MSKTVFEEKNEIVLVYEIEIEEEVYKDIKKRLFSVCGRQYGMWQNIGIGIVDFFRKHGINIKNPFSENENCSELLFRHFITIAYPGLEDLYDPDTISPADIETIMKQIGTKV